ncbi:MAG: hypothetical protein V3U54_01345 [Thermodesulfobacteriota bacterium]
MNGKPRKEFIHNVYLKAALIFVLSYILFLIIWIFIKVYCGNAITTVASYSIAGVKNVKFTETKQKDDLISVSFLPDKFGVKKLVMATIDVKI